MGNDIKNCPFCGGEANLFSKHKVHSDDIDNEYVPNGYAVGCQCTVCGARGKEFISLEYPEDVDWNNIACQDAIKAWNMRNDESKSKYLNFYDIMLKMALAYAQATYEYELRNDIIPVGDIAPPSVYRMDRFDELFKSACIEYNRYDLKDFFSNLVTPI